MKTTDMQETRVDLMSDPFPPDNDENRRFPGVSTYLIPPSRQWSSIADIFRNIGHCHNLSDLAESSAVRSNRFFVALVAYTPIGATSARYAAICTWNGEGAVVATSGRCESLRHWATETWVDVVDYADPIAPDPDPPFSFDEMSPIDPIDDPSEFDDMSHMIACIFTD